MTEQGLTYKRAGKGSSCKPRTSKKWCTCGRKIRGADHVNGSHHREGATRG